AFIWADSAVHLNPVAAVHTEIPFVIQPWHAEDDNAFRFHHAFQDGGLLVLGMFFYKRDKRLGNFVNGLVKFGLACVAPFYHLHELLNGRLFSCNHKERFRVYSNRLTGATIPVEKSLPM